MRHAQGRQDVRQQHLKGATPPSRPMPSRRRPWVSCAAPPAAPSCDPPHPTPARLHLLADGTHASSAGSGAPVCAGGFDQSALRPYINFWRSEAQAVGQQKRRSWRLAARFAQEPFVLTLVPLPNLLLVLSSVLGAPLRGYQCMCPAPIRYSCVVKTKRFWFS